jgi:hypothetical protein
MALLTKLEKEHFAIILAPNGHLKILTMPIRFDKWGMNLCDEYQLRYGKVHSCYNTLVHAYYIFPKGKLNEVTPFVRAMPDELNLTKALILLLLTRCISHPNLGLHLLSSYTRTKPEWVSSYKRRLFLTKIHTSCIFLMGKNGWKLSQVVN